ncbi:MAG: pilin [Candidatus Saccharibacteria bacterium]|nr:pilin [Candidatus Saccharibacteria bacterium]
MSNHLLKALTVIFAIIAIFSYPLFSNHNAEAISDISVKVKLVKTLVTEDWSGASTLSNGYYLYTDGYDKNGKTKVVRCSWPKINNCKTIVKRTNLGHANAMVSQLDSSYFCVLDIYNHKQKGHHWCFDSRDGKKISDSKYGNLPPEWDNRQEGKKNGTYKYFGGEITSTKTQDLAEYGQYLLKAYASPNRIEIRKNGKAYAVLKPELGGEMEGVFVDGNTGTIYCTKLAKNNSKHLTKIYKITNYKLPIQPVFTSAIAETVSEENNPSGKGAPSNSSISSNTSPATPVHDDTVSTTLFGTIKDDGKGCGIFMILNNVVEVLTYGVGILGVLGITIVGIQYLTAAGDEEKTRKAKRRLLEIIIGIIAYALLWFFLSWLTPGGKLNSSTTCTTATTTSCQVADTPTH